MELERGHADKGTSGKAAAASQSQQLSIFGHGSGVEEELRKLDIDSMTPIEAINKLYELKKKADGNS
jgi:DNA mismatch repair protein MutS